MAAFMAVGIPGNAGSGLSMTAQAAGSGEMAGNVGVFDQADLFLEEEEKELQQAIDALREKMDMDAAVVTAERKIPVLPRPMRTIFMRPTALVREAAATGRFSDRHGQPGAVYLHGREDGAVSDGQPDRSGAGRHVRAMPQPETITRQPERLWRIWRSATTTGSPRTSIITTRRPERSAATGRCAGMRPCLPWRLRLPAAALPSWAL